MVLNLWANQNTGPAYSAKVCFMEAGNITTYVRHARSMSGLIILDVYVYYRDLNFELS